MRSLDRLLYCCFLIICISPLFVANETHKGPPPSCRAPVTCAYRKLMHHKSKSTSLEPRPWLIIMRNWPTVRSSKKNRGLCRALSENNSRPRQCFLFFRLSARTPQYFICSTLLFVLFLSFSCSSVWIVQRQSSPTGNDILSFALVATRDLLPGDELWTTKPPTNSTIAAHTPTLQDYQLIDQIIQRMEADFGGSNNGLTNAEWIGTCVTIGCVWEPPVPSSFSFLSNLQS